MDGTIKTENIFRIVSEITEALSLTNIPNRLLDMALDAMSRKLDMDCCWVQMLTSNDHELSLSAYCGFTPYMRDKMARVNLNHPLGQEVVGLGNSIIIPDLSRDGHFDISLFEEAGFSSLMAVPIMTYRVQGIMGVGYRTKKQFTRDDSNFLTIIAGVIGMAVNKCILLEQANRLEKSQVSDSVPHSLSPADKSQVQEPELLEYGDITSGEQLGKRPVCESSEAYKGHLQKMTIFRNSHKPLSNK